MCTVILAYESSHCLADREHALSDYSLELACSGDGSYSDGIKGVERALHDHGSGCGNAVLDRHRDAEAELLLYDPAVNLPVGLIWP